MFELNFYNMRSKYFDFNSLKFVTTTTFDNVLDKVFFFCVCSYYFEYVYKFIC